MSESLSVPALDIHLPARAASASEREYEAFLRLLPQLLQTQRGQFVAIHNGKVVDAGSDDIALVRRVHARIGYVPIYVGMVSEQLPVVRMPHYRECQAQEGRT